MNIEQIPEVIEIAEKVETRLIKEMANLIDSRGVSFAVSVYTSALSRVIGSALALSKSQELRNATHQAVSNMIAIAMVEANATYAADDAIEKASKP